MPKKQTLCPACSHPNDLHRVGQDGFPYCPKRFAVTVDEQVVYSKTFVVRAYSEGDARKQVDVLREKTDFGIDHDSCDVQSEEASIDEVGPDWVPPKPCKH